MNIESKYIQLVALANKLECEPEKLIDLGISRELKILANKDFYACSVDASDLKTPICGNVQGWFFINPKDLKGFHSREEIYCDSLYDVREMPFIPRWPRGEDPPPDILQIIGGVVKIQIKKEELYILAEEAERSEKKYFRKGHDKEATDLTLIFALVQLLIELSDLKNPKSILEEAEKICPVSNTTLIFSLVKLLTKRSDLKTQKSILEAVKKIFPISKTTFNDRLKDARKLISPEK